MKQLLVVILLAVINGCNNNKETKSLKDTIPAMEYKYSNVRHFLILRGRRDIFIRVAFFKVYTVM